MYLDHFVKGLILRMVYLSGTLFVAWFGFWVVYKLRHKYRIRNVIKKKQEEREAKQTELEVQYYLSQEHDRILQLEDEELIGELQSRQVKATFVLEAYIAKALQINREFNCITEFIPQAMEWAEKLDKMKERKGPLHGLPVSIKDNCDVMGMDSTLGLGKRLYKPAGDHAVLVKVLMDLGAVPFCKTNVPQTLLSFDCTNPIFGTTKNFLNPKLTPGGSSGGESTLIAAGGSIIGLGSDIGGSVRIPAHFSGIVGLKVTKDRLSPRGYQASIPNAVGIVGVPGLMARKTTTLKRIFRQLVDGRRQQKYDPFVVPLGFDEAALSTPLNLRIGYFTSLPFFPLIGDTEKVVLSAKKAFESMGHTLVPFKPPDSFYIFELISDFALADNGENFMKNWESEPIPRGLLTNYLVCSLPRWVRLIIATLIDLILPYVHSPRAARILKGGALTSERLLSCLGERKAMIERVTNEWRRLNLDLVLCPVFPYPAIPHNAPGRQQAACIYTMMWNLFDFPCGTIPFGKESGEKIDEYDPMRDFTLRAAKKMVKESVGMPISVQVVGLPYEEEKVLRGMQLLESLSDYSGGYWGKHRIPQNDGYYYDDEDDE